MKFLKEQGQMWAEERKEALENDEYTKPDILHHILNQTGNSARAHILPI